MPKYHNKYEKIYFDIINKYKKLDLKKSNNIYLETHHIIPKCLGGSDSLDNRVNLPPREHFICHRLLTKFNRNPKLIFAIHMFCNQNNRFGRNIKISSRLYSYIRKIYAADMSMQNKGRKPSFKGKGSSPEGTIKNLRKLAEQRRGIPRSNEVKIKISQSHHKNNKLKNYFKNNKHPFLGSHHSEESKRKISKSLKGKKAWNKGIIGKYKCSKETKEKMKLARQKFNSMPKIISISTGEKFLNIQDIMYKKNISYYLLKKNFDMEYKYI